MQLLESHRLLISDETGQEAFRRAIFETVRGGETVLDLGTGTGIHTVFACQAGAGQVYAVDQNEVIELAREICRANGCVDRVRFLHAPAAQLDLPEQVDVIVTHLGLSGLFRLLPPVRDRFLKRSGVLIPAVVQLFAAPLEAPAAYQEGVEFWKTRHHSVTFAPVHSVAVNTVHDCRIDPMQLLGEPASLASFECSQIKAPKLSAMVETQIARRGVLHGVGVWYVEWLTKNIPLSTAPASQLPSPLWLNRFLPIATPVPLEAGETVRMRIRTGTGGWGHCWSWEVGVTNRHGGEKARFAHSTFSNWVVSRDALRKQALDYVPGLAPHGAAAGFVLESCNGSTPLRRIEEEVFQRFPALFRSPSEAAGFVAELVTRYSL